MEHEYEHDLCVVGPGRIGLPWAASLARNGYDVLCIDIDEERVESINKAEAPFHEPKMQDYMAYGVEKGNLQATTDMSKVADAKVVGFTLNAPEDEQEWYLNVLGQYAENISPEQVIVNRTTLPIDMVEKSKEIMVENLDASIEDINYVTFPERLAEGKAIQEIKKLPKIAGTNTEEAKKSINWLTESFEGKTMFTDEQTAMFAKVIDNTYRDAKFAIANQLGIIAEELGLDAHEAIEIANEDYPRNDIPTPGTVGGKCLMKDPHFIMDKSITEQPKTPDLFYNTRKVNREVEDRIFDSILAYRPETVAILGTGFKRNNGDEFNSPAIRLKQRLEKLDIETDSYDPHVEGRNNLEKTIKDTDLVLVAVNHSEFERKEQEIKELSGKAPIIDVWGIFDKEDNIERFGSGR